MLAYKQTYLHIYLLYVKCIILIYSQILSSHCLSDVHIISLYKISSHYVLIFIKNYIVFNFIFILYFIFISFRFLLWKGWKKKQTNKPITSNDYSFSAGVQDQLNSCIIPGKNQTYNYEKKLTVGFFFASNVCPFNPLFNSKIVKSQREHIYATILCEYFCTCVEHVLVCVLCCHGCGCVCIHV